MVGIKDCCLEVAYFLEQFLTFFFVAILFTLLFWGDRQPRYHMYRLSSSTLPSISTWEQLNGETLAGKAHVTKMNKLTE
jgi:hypothetical protein